MKIPSSSTFIREIEQELILKSTEWLEEECLRQLATQTDRLAIGDRAFVKIPRALPIESARKCCAMFCTQKNFRKQSWVCGITRDGFWFGRHGTPESRLDRIEEQIAYLLMTICESETGPIVVRPPSLGFCDPTISITEMRAVVKKLKQDGWPISMVNNTEQGVSYKIRNADWIKETRSTYLESREPTRVDQQ
jgi:hypothetical protein